MSLQEDADIKIGGYVVAKYEQVRMALVALNPH